MIQTIKRILLSRRDLPVFFRVRQVLPARRVRHRIDLASVPGCATARQGRAESGAGGGLAPRRGGTSDFLGSKISEKFRCFADHEYHFLCIFLIPKKTRFCTTFLEHLHSGNPKIVHFYFAQTCLRKMVCA